MPITEVPVEAPLRTFRALPVVDTDPALESVVAAWACVTGNSRQHKRMNDGIIELFRIKITSKNRYLAYMQKDYSIKSAF